MESYVPPFRGRSIYICYLEFLCIDLFVLPGDVFIQSSSYVQSQDYVFYILRYIQCYFIYFVAQIFTALAIENCLVDFYVPLTYSHARVCV